MDTARDMGDEKQRLVMRGKMAASQERTTYRLVPREGAADVMFGERKPRWTVDILKLVGIIVSTALLVHALALLLRAGFDDWDLFEPHVNVGELHGTRLMAYIEGVSGLFVLYATVGDVANMALRVFGFFAAVVGAVLLIEPNSVHDWVGVHEINGVAALGIGAALVLASLTPVLNVYPKPPPRAPAPWERSQG